MLRLNFGLSLMRDLSRPLMSKTAKSHEPPSDASEDLATWARDLVAAVGKRQAWTIPEDCDWRKPTATQGRLLECYATQKRKKLL